MSVVFDMYNIEIMDDFAGKSENETMRVIPNITDILICLKIFDTVNPKFEFNVCACRKILAIILYTMWVQASF